AVASILRSVLAVLVGLILISIVVEALEAMLVLAVHGGLTTDPVVYFGVRNRPWFLALNLVYNTAAAIFGGFLTARIAGRLGLTHGLILAIVQTVAFLYALAMPDMRQWTPTWMWIALIVVTAAGIVYGARIAKRG